MTQQDALKILKTGANVYLTGEPGAGKTHTVNAYIDYLREHEVEPAITASTGIAATHIGGMTIHSWSGIGIRTKLDKYELDKIASTEYIVRRVRRTKILIIDEVSMLHANMLDMVDAVCREVRGSSDPFGGMQVVLVGDFFQLPPISKKNHSEDSQEMLFEAEEKASTNFAYDASVWKRLRPMICYLSEQHRQDDDDFLAVLSAIRRSEVLEEHREHIMGRQTLVADAPENTTRLFSHNVDVDRVNSLELAKIAGDQKVFAMHSEGKDSLVAALQKGCLSPESLYLKVGAVVMCTKNNQKDGYVNGTLGTVVNFETFSGNPIIKTRAGILITMEPMDWTVEENGKIRAQITQIPLRLAWAMTVHKSQGMSLDAAVMDLSSVFEFGQGYVALSRVRRLKGLFLLGLNEQALKVHPDVLEKDIEFREMSENAADAFEKLSEREVVKMQENFILACGGTVVAINKEKIRTLKAKKPETKSITLALWNEGKNISEIARERTLTVQTIFDHIEQLVEDDKISIAQLARIVTPALKKSLPEIHKAFRTLDTDKLTPVKEHFKDKYSFDDLRIARMLLAK